MAGIAIARTSRNSRLSRLGCSCRPGSAHVRRELDSSLALAGGWSLLPAPPPPLQLPPVDSQPATTNPCSPQTLITSLYFTLTLCPHAALPPPPSRRGAGGSSSSSSSSESDDTPSTSGSDSSSSRRGGAIGEEQQAGKVASSIKTTYKLRVGVLQGTTFLNEVR